MATDHSTTVLAGGKPAVDAPAFQWYPRDYLTDEEVVLMELDEEGAYRRLMDHCWLEGSIPAKMADLAKLARAKNVRHMQRMWPKMAMKFVLDGNRYLHPRLEEERAKQALWRAKSAEGGKKSAASRKGGSTTVATTSQPPLNHPTNQSPTLLSSSSSASSVQPPTVSVGHTRRTTLVSGPPLTAAYAGRPPVPAQLHVELRSALAGDEAENDRRLRAWYVATSQEWEGRDIGDNSFRFWRARFQEWIGTTVKSKADTAADKRKAVTAAFLAEMQES